MKVFNVVFMGSAELSCPSLSALLQAPGFRVLAAVTQPDRPKGRHLKLVPSPVKELALKHGLSVLQPERARNDEFIGQFRALAPDIAVVVAYGQILPRAILETPRFGCVNIHTSILPKYRGAAPIQWAVLNGDPETGVTLMQINEGLDTGEILEVATTSIRPEDDAATLHDRLAQMGAELLVRRLPRFVAGEIRPRPQPAEGASYARKIKKEDGDINWNLPAHVILNKVRGLTPWPGACTYYDENGARKRLKILKAQVVELSGPAGTVLKSAKDQLIIGCGEQALSVLQLQAEGGKALETRQFLAGRKFPEGYGFSGAGPIPSIQ